MGTYHKTLTDEQVEQAERLYMQGFDRWKICRETGIELGQLGHLVHRGAWAKKRNGDPQHPKPKPEPRTEPRERVIVKQIHKPRQWKMNGSLDLRDGRELDRQGANICQRCGVNPTQGSYCSPCGIARARQNEGEKNFFNATRIGEGAIA